MSQSKYSYTFLKEKYLEGLSIEKIAAQYHVSGMRLAKLLKADGVVFRKGNPKYEHNKNVFDVIDTEEKAYWLGFLYADGAIGYNRPRVGLAIGIKDLKHLEKFRDFISPQQKNIACDKLNIVHLTIYDKHIYQKLISHGCIPQKTFKLEFPTTVPVELISHFIRGYFDGDGHIGLSGVGHVTFSMLGNLQFLREVHATFLKNLPEYKPGGLHKKGNVYAISKMGCNTQVEALVSYLYKDATIFIERKKQIADKFAALRRNS
jgi:hypothetical protein